MRLDKALALSGIARAQARKQIAAGRVCVKGVPVRDCGAQVEPADVELDGRAIEAEREVYLMINKPAGVITATEDKNLPTVVSLLSENYRRRKIGPVGRLDRDVTGLVLLTTDGQLAHRLISPKWKAEKCYLARCAGRLSPADCETFKKGVQLDEFTARPAGLKILSAGTDESQAEVTLTEGKFHQVKKMFAAIGHPILALRRLRIGCVTLDEALQPGEWRRLTDIEIEGLKRMSGLSKEDTTLE